MDVVTGIHIEVHGYTFFFIPCLASSLIQRIFIRNLQGSEYYDFLSVFDHIILLQQPAKISKLKCRSPKESSNYFAYLCTST